MSTTKKCLLAALMLFLSLGSAHPGLTQENSGDTLAQMQQEDWKIVQSGVLQRELGEGEVETFVFGVQGFTWKIQDLGRQLRKLRAELRAHPTPELRKVIASHRKAIANARRALDLARENEGFGDEMVLPKAGCINFVYDAAASYKTDVQGVWASSNAAFKASCGSSTGQVYAYAFAKTTVNGAETTETVTDGPRSGSNVSASAYASRNGGSLCESYAYGEMVSYSLSPSSYSKSADNFTCPVPTPPNQPVADFSFICMDLACSFNGSSSTGTSLIYTWSFGDSTPNGTGITTSHIYPGEGSYTATLTITDSLGRQSSRSKKVSVTNELPVADESFFTVPPCRIADTRNTTPLTSNVQRLFQVTGLCGIPASAKAVSFNVTVVSPTGPGHLVFRPGNQTSGPFAHATINFDPANSPRANNAILRLATNGAGSVNVHPFVAASPGEVHVLLDVYGYFSEDATPAPGAQGPFGFQTLPPCRIADTRTGPPIAAGTISNFTVQGGPCGVPVGAAAAALNFTILSPTAGGHAILFQAGAFPPVPTINFNAGVVLTNGVRIRLAPTTPDVSVNYYSPIAGAQSTHATIDVFGYFKPDAPLKYRPITACRAVDTRFADRGGPVLASPDTRNFQIRGNCGVPLSAKAVAVNITSVGSAGGGYLVAYPSGGTLPLASYLTFDPGQGALGNGGIVALSTLPNDLAVTTANSTHVIIDVFGYFQ